MRFGSITNRQIRVENPICSIQSWSGQSGMQFTLYDGPEPETVLGRDGFNGNEFDRHLKCNFAIK